MVNAHLLAVTNAGTSPVNASAAGCKNCPGSSAPGETPSFATLLDAQANATSLEAQTNEGTLLSDQQPAENDLANALIAAPLPQPEVLPAALLALAANDALPNGALLTGEQAVTDDITPAPLKPETLLGDLIAKPASPDAQSQPLPNFAENLAAVAGRIEPRTITGPDNIAGSGEQPVTAQTNRVGTIAASSPVIVAQDNLVQPAAPLNQAPEALLNTAGLPTTGDDPFAITNAPSTTGAAAPISTAQAPIATDPTQIATGENNVARSPITAINPQPYSSPETPIILNDNAQSPVPVAEKIAAKTNIGTGDTPLTRPTIETQLKVGGVAAKPNGEAAPGPQNAAPAQSNSREMAASDAGAANKVATNAGEPVTNAPQNAGAAQTNPRETATLDASTINKAPTNAGGPVIDTPTRVKIERNAPLTPTASAAPEPGASPEEQVRPASLMQRLKPLAQAAFSFQGMENAQNSAKTLDGMAPAISMTTIGDLARPSGITGLTPTLNNPALPQVPLNNIAVHIASQASAGHQRLNIRLDPPELGRIDIRLEIGRDGQTMTHLAVEKPETLDLLRQDARTLERALNNAGLDSRNGSLSFSLKDDNQNKQQAGSAQSNGTPDADENHVEQEGDEPVMSRTLNMSSGLDISI